MHNTSLPYFDSMHVRKIVYMSFQALINQDQEDSLVVKQELSLHELLVAMLVYSSHYCCTAVTNSLTLPVRADIDSHNTVEQRPRSLPEPDGMPFMLFAVQDLIQQSGCNFKEHVWPDRWYFTKGKQLLGSTDHVSHH